MAQIQADQRVILAADRQEWFIDQVLPQLRAILVRDVVARGLIVDDIDEKGYLKLSIALSVMVAGVPSDHVERLYSMTEAELRAAIAKEIKPSRSFWGFIKDFFGV